MWKWILGGLAVVVLIVGGLGLFGWSQLSKPIDPTSDIGKSYADGFKREFVTSCTQSALQAAGGAADENTRAKLTDVCTCGADAVFTAYQNEPPTRLLTVASDPAEQEKITGIMQECAAQAGLQ